MGSAASGDQLAGNPYTDSDGDIHWNATTIYAEAANIALDTTTGTKIGTATTQKLGFFNATPVVQRTTYTQTYATAAKTVPAEVVAITGGESPTEAEHNLVVADVLALKKLINALIDDLQALGLVA